MGTLFSVYGLAFVAMFFTIASSNFPSYHTIIHFPPKPVILPVRKGNGSDKVEEKSYRELIETGVPSLFKDFKPLWWLFNGHLQTLYCVFGNFTKHEKVWYKRTYLRVADGGTLGIDFAPPDIDSNPNFKEDTPIIVLQHGLTGGSYEPYIRAIISRATLPKDKGGLGYRAVVINFRGCAGVPVTSARLYSAGHTDDTRNALIYIAHRYPKAPLLAIGFSLGANVVTRYLGEDKEHSRFHAACALGCPWDLEDNSLALLSTFIGKHVYSKGMGGNLYNLLKRHEKSLTADPEHFVAKAAVEALALKNPTLYEFDTAFTSKAGGPTPQFPFPSARDYYLAMSSHFMIKDIQVPYLSINAADDPVVRRVPMNDAKNPLVTMVVTAGGGHLGWFQGGGDGFVDRWTTRPILEWLKLMGDDVLYECQKPRGRKILVEDDGWLREESQPHLGCKEIEGGGVIDGNSGEAGILQGL